MELMRIKLKGNISRRRSPKGSRGERCRELKEKAVLTGAEKVQVRRGVTAHSL